MSNYKFDTSNPDFNILEDESQKELFLSVMTDKSFPENISLKQGFWLLRTLDPSMGKLFFGPKGEYKNFIFEKNLAKRNNSILAHGFSPVNEADAAKFINQIEGILLNLFENDYKAIKTAYTIPEMPAMGF